MFLCLVVLCSLVGVGASSKLFAAGTHAAATHPSIPICPGAAAGSARCRSYVVTDSQGRPLASSSPPAGSYGPAQFHGGYNLPCSVGGTGPQAVCTNPTTFGGQTIAIVD